MKTNPESKPDFHALARKAFARGLNHVSELAMHMNSLEGLHDRMVSERDEEGDASENPDKMRAWLDNGYGLLRDMCGEETAENSAGTQAPDAYYWSASQLDQAIERAFDRAGLVRKGARFSAESLRCMRSVHTHIRAAHDELGDLLSDAGESSDDEGDDEEKARALAERKARAEAIRARATAA